MGKKRNQDERPDGLTNVSILVDEEEFETYTNFDMGHTSPIATILAICHLSQILYENDVDVEELFDSILEDLKENCGQNYDEPKFLS